MIEDYAWTRGIYKWFIGAKKKDRRVMKSVDYFQVRGAGLLWVLLYWPFFLVFTKIVIGAYKELSKIYRFDIIIPLECIFLIVGFVFSYIEMNRIRILDAYDKAGERFMTKQRESYKRVMNAFNSMLDVYESDPRNEESLKTSFVEFRDLALGFKKEYFPEEDNNND